MSGGTLTQVAPAPRGPRKTVFLLPWYKSTNPLTAFSLLANWDPNQSGVTMSYNDAMVQHARNRLADRFVESPEPFEWALFVDDDMVLPTGDGSWFRAMTHLRPGKWTGRALDGLLRHGKTVVGALYVGRDPRGVGHAMFSGGADPELLRMIRRGEASGVHRVPWVGTGCLLVHRSVFLDIRKAFPHLAPKRGDKPWHYFTPMADAAVKLLGEVTSGDTETVTLNRESVEQTLRDSLVPAHAGEDVVFCHRATAAGHPVFVDFDVVCGHMGAVAWGPSNTHPA